jgi:L-alanine-DL-glutamate epimerase-like enolase superfamily enzyme
MYKIHSDFPQRKPCTGEQLDAIINSHLVMTSDIPNPLVIDSIRMLVRGDFCYVITRTDSGIEGISIASGNWKVFYPILEQKIAPYFIGTDARDLESTLDFIYVQDLNYKIQGLAYWCCVSWIEASILDILGKAAGKPIGGLFGPRCHDMVDFYCASGNRGTTPEEEIEILARRIAPIGVKAIKFKVGGRMSNDADSMKGRSEGLIFKARKFFGDDMIIHADGNGSYSPKVAIEYGKMLEEINAYFYEEPCPFDHLWETKEVADAVTIPLAFGEQETSLRRFRWLIENDAAQVLQPDIQYNGGFIRTAKVARMADLAGIPVTLHISGGVHYAYVLMLASFTPNMGKYQEMKNGYPETKDFFTTNLVLKDGAMNIPTGVGLGMAFDRNHFDRATTIFVCDQQRKPK